MKNFKSTFVILGLGKTIEAISLILSNMNNSRFMDFKPHHLPDRKVEFYGGTLIVCPATLIDQWSREFEKFVAPGYVRLHKFHGQERENNPRELSKNYDVVLTSYQTVMAEHKTMTQSNLFVIKWDRIILDEAHTIRNYRTITSTSICALVASSYWALTGTPVQNKETDVYSLIKFLHCDPFDDYAIWRVFMVTPRNSDSNKRLQALLKCLMLRRTKEELADAGKIERLPTKHFNDVRLKLNEEEQKVHDAFMSISRAIFIRFLEQKIEKNPELAWKYRDITRNAKVDITKLHEKFVKIAGSRVIKHHHLLTILLRLRQICLHPTLIHGSLESEVKQEQGMRIENSDDEDDADIKNQTFDLMDGLKKMIAMDEGEIDETDDEFGEHANRIRVLSKTNPIFKRDYRSTKMNQLMEALKVTISESLDKIIIVCSFVEFLFVIRDMLIGEGIRYCEYNGKVRIEDRDAIVADFNCSKSPVRVMLLSLTAGGVGLNLTGANQMFILDLHWNPQWEVQVQDRIHRFGQKKEIHISK